MRKVCLGDLLDVKQFVWTIVYGGSGLMYIRVLVSFGDMHGVYRDAYCHLL